MANQTGFLFTLIILLLIIFAGRDIAEVEGANEEDGVYNEGFVKLFVFGDSYVDTGNFLKSDSYKFPNGFTFPGKPAGRFSDGRVLTDYIASFLRIRSPVPYRLRKLAEKSMLENGMNFARGGTGIFDTFSEGPNMTIQIDTLQKLIQQNVYTKHDLESSVALVHAGGNDFTTFCLRNGTLREVGAFTSSLINQLSSDIDRIHGLGVRKIAVGLLMPMGCLPLQSVATSYKTCVETPNVLSRNHNQMLLQSVANLNRQLGKSVFLTLDLYNAFLSTLTLLNKIRHAEHSRRMNPLQPCLNTVNKKGAKRYMICEKPELSFFWDEVHPSQNGWHAACKELQSSLHQLILQEY